MMRRAENSRAKAKNRGAVVLSLFLVAVLLLPQMAIAAPSGVYSQSVIARSEATKQSSDDNTSGLLRYARNDDEASENSVLEQAESGDLPGLENSGGGGKN